MHYCMHSFVKKVSFLNVSYNYKTNTLSYMHIMNTHTEPFKEMSVHAVPLWISRGPETEGTGLAYDPDQTWTHESSALLCLTRTRHLPCHGSDALITLMVHTNHRFLWGLTKASEVQSSLFPCTVPKSPPQRPATVNLIKPSNITFCLLLQPAEIGQKPAGKSLIRPHHHTLVPFLHG